MPSGLALSGFLVAVLAVWQAAAQAPGDEDARCVTQRGDVYPPNVTMLMDSRNYENLISRSNPHWQALDVDGTGIGWSSAFGGLCQSEPESCDYRETASQENWFFTQYISYLQAREVFVNVTSYFESCRLARNPTCNQFYVDMYRYERNGTDRAAARTTSNYGQPIRRIQPNGLGLAVNEISFPFIPSGNFNGFYIGVRATGTCASIRRLQVYYNTFQPPPPCPVTGLPPQGTTIRLNCPCPANSVRTSSNHTLTCSSDGTCTGNTSCQCLEGYRQLPRQCEACPAGTYRSHSDPAGSCLSCPANTTTSGVTVAICPCIAGHFRAAGEGPGFACIEPPTAVVNLRVNSARKSNTSITVLWEPPIGSSDYYYNVEYSDPDNVVTYRRHNQERITNTNAGTQTYTLTGLQPNTTYTIRVSVHNRVSGNDSQNDDRRRQQVSENTKEGVPSAPSSIRGLCTVVVWGQPLRTNGQLLGFDLRFYRSDSDYERIVRNGSEEIFRIVKETDVPSDQGGILVQVRGETRAGAGNWTEGVPLGCSNSGPAGTTTTGQGVNTTISGYVQIWYLGVAVAGSSLVTAIVVIAIVLVVVCICSRRKKGHEVEKTNGVEKNEYRNPSYEYTSK